MTTLLKFIDKPSKKPIFRGFFNFLKYLLEHIKFKKKQEYKPISVNFKSVYPDEYSTNTFEYLEKAYEGRIMKRFKD